MNNPVAPPRYDPQPIQKFQSLWHPPWYVYLAAQQGPNHFAQGQLMQDSHIVGAVGDVTWMVVADGVGNASRSDEASRLACHVLNTFFGARLTEGRSPTLDLIREGMAAAHEAILAFAREAGLDPVEFETTLIAALLQGDTVMAASLGDSSIAISTKQNDDGNGETMLFTPFCTGQPREEEGNFTRTLVDADWAQHVAFNELSDPSLNGVWLATDGGRFFVEPIYEDCSEHTFDHLWPNLIEKNLEDLTPLKMAVFMDEIPAERNDDRTIIVAYRPAEDHAPPSA